MDKGKKGINNLTMEKPDSHPLARGSQSAAAVRSHMRAGTLAMM